MTGSNYYWTLLVDSTLRTRKTQESIGPILKHPKYLSKNLRSLVSFRRSKVSSRYTIKEGKVDEDFFLDEYANHAINRFKLEPIFP